MMMNEEEEYYDDEFSDHHDDHHPIHDSEGEDGSDQHSLFSDDNSGIDNDDDDDNDSMSSETDSVASVLVVKEDIKLMNVVRAIVILILLTFSFITAESVFVVATIAQQDNFRRSYDQVATMIIETVHERVRSRLWAAQGLATDLSLTARQAEESWPNVTYEGFAARCASTKHVTSATAIAFTPLVPSKDRIAWEAYVTEQAAAAAAASNVIILSNNDPQQFNNKSAGAAVPAAVVTYYPTHRSVEDGIYRFQDAVAVDDDQGPSYRGSLLFPMWQTTTAAAPAASAAATSDSTPSTGLTGGVLFNEVSNTIRREALGRMVGAYNGSNGRSTMSDFLFENANGTDFAHYSTPAASIYYPIYGAYVVVQGDGETTTTPPNQQGQEQEEQEDDEVVVGAVNMELPWDTFLDGVLEAYDEPVHVVVENVCGRMFTYEVQGFDTVTFLGQGDHHDPEVDGYAPTNSSYEDFAALFDDHGRRQPNNDDDDDGCNNYRITVYATEDFKTSYINNKAELYRGLVLLVFLSTVIIFIIYDCLVERRQNRLVTAAVRADTIVQSLFPSTVRARLYEKQSVKKKLKNHNETNNANAPTEEPHHHVNPWKSVASKELSSGEDGGVQIETPKNRLRDFMAASPADQAAQHMKHDGTSAFAIEPIADFFPNTTVLFADIAGFTAWSSEREPSQVFALLETLYRSMDKAAKRFHVFKVETIGDCYVAATGVPEPQAHHAEIMVKFARTSMLRVNELTKRLESTLGPGTAELAMRFGIHSGPVTAGVLRGKKARFQLFGDTMNVASRMESSGLKNKIHVSGDTASILIAEGHQHWIAPRHDKVTLKGKGAMQTYWILLGNSSGSHVSSASSVSSGDQSSACMADECYTGATEATNFAHTAPLPRVIKKKNMLIEKICKGTELESVLGQTDVTDSTSRMIDWNVDVLLTMLKRVVAQRVVREEREQRQQQQQQQDGIDGEQQQQEQSPSSSSGSIPSSSQHANQIGVATTGGGGPVLDEICMVIEMPDFKVDLCNEAAQRNVTITNRVRRELRDYVACIASGYRQDNAFHNFEHASHVIMSANKLIKRICAPDTVGTKTDFTTADLNAHTYGIGTDPLTHFAVTFSALIHDVGHTGVPNGRLAVEDPEVAAKYVNKSIAEQRSVDIAWDLLLLPHFDHLRDCIYQNDQDRQRFRRLVVNSVLATDIFDKELKQLRNHRWDLAFHGGNNDNDKQQQQQKDQHQEVAVTKRDVHRKATIVIEHIIQASDVAHTMQHWYIYQKWNGRLFKEMYFAYLLGRSEKDPSQGWYGGELWFFDNYVIPLADKLKECGVFGVSHDEYSNYARQNRREWELKGKDSVEKMKAEAEKEATRLGLLKMEGIQEEEEDTEGEGGEEEKVEEETIVHDQEEVQEEEPEREASSGSASSNSQSDYSTSSSSFTNSVTTLTAPEDSQDGIAQEGEELVAMEEAAGATTTAAAAAAAVPVAGAAAAAPPAAAACADASADAAATTATTTTAVVNGAITGKNTRTVIAPPGRLGIVIDNSSLNGNDTNVPVVHSVGDDSPMRGKLYAGDLLVSIDGVETKGMSVSALQALLAANAHQTRGFCILRGRGSTTMANASGGGPTNADDDDDQENTA